MPLISLYNDTIQIDKVILDKPLSLFEISNSQDPDDNSFLIDYVLPIEDGYNLTNYELYTYFSQDVSENDIFQVYEKHIDKRIGWIFPITSLVSREHSKSSDIHFLKYAFIAFQLLLLDSNNRKILEIGKQYYLTSHYEERSIYPENTIVLVLCKDCLKEINNFEINHYLPSLFFNGYYYKNAINVKKVVDDKKNTRERVNITKISEELNDEQYIYDLFQELIFETHPFVKFHLLYQIVEMLIEKILHNEIKIISAKLKERKIYARDFKDKIAKFEPENKRINKLFVEYSRNIDKEIINNLKGRCNDFLKSVNRNDEICDNIDKIIYSVRNFLVHDYRNIPKESVKLLIELNYSFEKLCVYMLMNFKRTE